MEAEAGGYETGYTLEASDDFSLELMNDQVVDISSEEVLDGDVSVYDLEHMETDDGVIHFDRPTALLDPVEDEVAVLRGGELEYHGSVSGLGEFLAEQYEWNMEEVGTGATVKVGARIEALENPGSESYEEFVNDDYAEAMSKLGDAFRSFPKP